MTRSHDAAHDADSSSGTPDETASEISASDVDPDSQADLAGGALSPGSTATGGATGRE